VTSRRSFANALLVLASAMIGYVLVEAAYRFIQYRNLLDEIVSAAVAQIPRDGLPSSVYDPLTGYRYRPNIEVGPATRPFPVHYRTNNHGLVARDDFPLAKPAGEFRIGVIGDSFTANVTSTLRWTDVAEDALNASPEWRAATGAQHTQVINFGLDGIGAVQFGAVARHVALPFGLDMLLVNMIKDDLIRRPHVRGREPAVGAKDMAQFVRANVLAQLDWFHFYPEVLAVIAGPTLGLAPHLTMQAVEAVLSTGIYYDTADEATYASAMSIDTILGTFADATFLLDTSYAEFLGQRSPLADEAFGRLLTEFPAVKWINVGADRRHPVSRGEIDAWFNVPHDQHRNDFGVRIYGEAVAAFLIARQRVPHQ
jgi:hypothetical protein